MVYGVHDWEEKVRKQCNAVVTTEIRLRLTNVLKPFHDSHTVKDHCPYVPHAHGKKTMLAWSVGLLQPALKVDMNLKLLARITETLQGRINAYFLNRRINVDQVILNVPITSNIANIIHFSKYHSSGDFTWTAQPVITLLHYILEYKWWSQITVRPSSIDFTT